MPPPQHNEMSGMTLALRAAERRSCTVAKGVMDCLEERYGANYAPNTRETFRCQVLHQFVQGCRLQPFRPRSRGERPARPLRHYGGGSRGRSPLRNGGIPPWPGSAANAAPSRNVTSANAISPGDAARRPGVSGRAGATRCGRLRSSTPRFVHGAGLPYLGDTTSKDLFVDKTGLAELGIPGHDMLPDVVLHDTRRNWLFLVEAVTGPMTPKRIVELEETLSACPAGAVCVSAFPDFGMFRRKAIAWETEVWLCDALGHTIQWRPVPRSETVDFFGGRERVRGGAKSSPAKRRARSAGACKDVQRFRRNARARLPDG